MSSAVLQIVRQTPPLEWTWRLRDGGGTLLTEAKLNPMRSGHQMLLEREALGRRMPGDRLREEMTSHLRELLGDKLADALERSPARTLTVVGTRPSEMALSLPFELIFGRGDPGAIVVRRIMPPPRPLAAQVASAERMVTAFPLTADQHYLPLHLEAELLAEHARGAGLPLDELFVCCTGEDILRTVRGASVAHLAGHGAEGALRCEWRERPATMLTSADLIEAWQEESPRLVVLGFCESSSERDDLRSARVAAHGEMSLAYYAARITATAHAPSSSMAFDLVSALPTAVIGMRTNADDAEARRFLDAFYAAHVRDGLDIEGAYSRALEEGGFVDGVGLPVPALYVGGEDPLLRGSEREAESRPGSVRCLTPAQRRLTNLMYKATSPLSGGIDGSWGCRIGGASPALRQGLARTLLTNAHSWREIQGAHGPTPVLAIGELDGNAMEILCPPVPRDQSDVLAIRIDLDRWPHLVTMGELLSASSEAEPRQLSLLGRATCDIPLLVTIVMAQGVDDVARALAERVGTSPLDDWELALALLDLLPEEDSAPIRRWAEERWAAVEAIGQVAIDALAAFAILAEDENLFDRDQYSLSAICERTGVTTAEQGAALSKLVTDGVVGYGTGPLEGDLLDTASCDQMTARRAWHHRSKGTREALARLQMEQELDRLPSIDMVESLATPDLTRLCELCLECAHPRLDWLLNELTKRADGREAARELRARADADLGPRNGEAPARANEDTRWGAWDALIHAGQFERAGALLDEIEAAGLATDHPLRIEANRLITRAAEPDQEELLRDARALEKRLIAEGPLEGASATRVEILLVVRQAVSSALQKLNRPGEAGEVLLEHFQETLKAGSHASACAYTGAHAVRMFCLNDEADRAREVCAILTPLVANLKPSSATILVHSAELELLVAEGRRVHAAAAAEELLKEIGEWDEPRPDQVRAAMVGCAAAFVGTPRAVALFTLVDLTGRGPSLLADERSVKMAHAWGALSVEEIVAAADELFALMPKAIEAMGVSRSDLRRGAQEFAEGFSRLSETPALTRLLGEKGARALSARAEAGCPLSARILAVAGSKDDPTPGGEETDDAVPKGRELAYDAAGLARDHPPLSDILDEILPADFKTMLLPLLPDAFNGGRDARLAWAAAVIEEAKEDGAGLESRALMAVIRGDVRTAWSAMLGLDDPRATAAICVAIEACVLWPGRDDTPPGPIPTDLLAVVTTTWEHVLDQSPINRTSATAAHLGLSSAFNSIQTLLDGLLVAYANGISLAQVAPPNDDEPLTRHVFELLWENAEAQLSLAQLTTIVEPEQSVEALRLLGVLARSQQPKVALQARSARLAAAVQRKLEDLIEPAFDDALDCLKGGDPADVHRISLLNVVALAALRVDRTGVAVDAARELLAHPTVSEAQHTRFGAFTLLFRCLIADERWEEAAESLAEAGGELGFSVACAILGQAPELLDSSRTTGFVEAMLPLLTAEDPLADSAPLRSARVAFLKQIGEMEAWEPIRRATTATLEEV